MLKIILLFIFPFLTISCGYSVEDVADVVKMPLTSVPLHNYHGKNDDNLVKGHRILEQMGFKKATVMVTLSGGSMHTAGMCPIPANVPLIFVNPEYANKLHSAIQIMLHEIGHCRYFKDHEDDGIMGSGSHYNLIGTLYWIVKFAEEAGEEDINYVPLIGAYEELYFLNNENIKNIGLLDFGTVQKMNLKELKNAVD